MNGGRRKRSIKSPFDERFLFLRAGWQDARENKPFDYKIVDKGNAPQAMAYESSRLRVLILKESGMAVPAWNALNCVPSRVQAAIQAANRLNEAARGTGLAVRPIGEKGWIKEELKSC